MQIKTKIALDDAKLILTVLIKAILRELSKTIFDITQWHVAQLLFNFPKIIPLRHYAGSEIESVVEIRLLLTFIFAKKTMTIGRYGEQWICELSYQQLNIDKWNKNSSKLSTFPFETPK